jgi:hypothetical protein
MSYNFNVQLAQQGFKIEVDTAANYGCWQFPDGSEGGGLWFEVSETSTPGDAGRVLTLSDYDGVFQLPKAVIAALLDSIGQLFIVDEDFK